MPGAKIAACLIVKDEERTLERCLTSIRPFVDEVNIYDTGSTDGTLALLDRLSHESTLEVGGTPTPLAPIRVERGEWRDDFSWARARSFAMASAGVGWLLWADADDEVIGGACMRTVVSELDPDIDVVVCAYDTALDNEGQPRVRTWRERLVRAGAGFTWQGNVHEFLAVPAGERRKARRADPQTLRWLHTSAGEWDPRRNIAALEATLARSARLGEPPDARALFHLGAELFWVGDFAAARACFERWLELYGGTTDDALTVINRLAACLRLDGDLDAALRLELDAFEARPDWLPTAAGLVQSYAALHRWADVVEWAERASRSRSPADRRADRAARGDGRSPASPGRGRARPRTHRPGSARLPVGGDARARRGVARTTSGAIRAASRHRPHLRGAARGTSSDRALRRDDARRASRPDAGRPALTPHLSQVSTAQENRPNSSPVNRETSYGVRPASSSAPSTALR